MSCQPVSLPLHSRLGDTELAAASTQLYSWWFGRLQIQRMMGSYTETTDPIKVQEYTSSILALQTTGEHGPQAQPGWEEAGNRPYVVKRMGSGAEK